LWGFWGKMTPKTSIERKALAGRALPYAISLIRINQTYFKKKTQASKHDIAIALCTLLAYRRKDRFAIAIDEK